MSILGVREIIPRTFVQKFGESPTAERRYVVTLDEPTPTQQIINTIGIFFGAQHPEFPFLRMLDGQVVETDRHHAEVVYKYELPKQQDLQQNPLARPDVWSFSTGAAQVPAFVYYHGQGNQDIRPLQNSAGDYFEGLTTTEAEVRATISGNRLKFPLNIAAAVTNAINNTPYLGGNAHTWLCSGIGAQQAVEVVNDTEVRYWQVTAELIFRASTHNLLLPNVGWNYLDLSSNPLTKRRAWVWDEEKTEKLASATPRALYENGELKADHEYPEIITRRIYKEVNFNSYFGTPPF